MSDMDSQEAYSEQESASASESDAEDWDDELTSSSQPQRVNVSNTCCSAFNTNLDLAKSSSRLYASAQASARPVDP